MSVAISMGQSERVAQYEVPDDELAIGSTLGSPTAVCILKASGALEKVYGTDIGETLFGSLTWRAYDEKTGMHLSRQKGGKFLIHPEHQEHRYTLDVDIGVHEDVFVHSGEPGPDGSVDPPGVYYCVTLTNDGSEPVSLAVYAYTELRGETEKDVLAEYDEKLQAFVAWNEGKSDQVRLFGCFEKPDTFEVAQNMAKAVDRRCPGPLSGQVEKVLYPLGALHHRITLKPGKSVGLHYLLSFGKGRKEAIKNYRACPSPNEALDRTRSFYHNTLKRAVVFTPSEEVNRGVLWAKANMLRVLIKAPTGWCFVNDPTRSSNSVGRDTAWFAYGADYFRPGFARDSLLAYVRNQEKNGLIVEYYDIRTNKTNDYGMNINDNTPLLILGLWHHYNTTGDRAFLEEVYGAAVKAGRRVLAERNEQGLVWCTAMGTSDYGIIGWRNVITGYQISGATTEVNSECYAALKTLSHMARTLGHHSDSAQFSEEAESLRTAINTHLKNPENGLYYLSIDPNGHPRSDVTSDLVFPVMYGVAEPDTAAAIISRLSDQDFWTPVGIRTTPRDAPDYNPDGKSDGPYGLLGGVWVGVSFWYAFAASQFNPDYMARALGESFKNYSADPRRNNTVPGQFSEWLHGETLVNEGMMLSPWFPPRYLWAAIEGAAGLDLSGDEIDLCPRLPSDWKWLGVRCLPYRGKMLAWLALRLSDVELYTTFSLHNSGAYRAYEEDITDQIQTRGANVCTLGLRQNNDLLLFVGSTSDETITTSVSVQLPLSGAYQLRLYDSLLSEWRDLGRRSAEALQRGHVLQVEQKGFNLLELTQEV